jgi:D-alanine-D-alanine ligase
MRVAFTYNLRLTDNEDEAEFDSADTVEAVAVALAGGGHQVEKIEVSGPASHLAARLEAYGPELVFNTAEGRRGRTREAFYPALFEELGFPYTGSDAYALTLTLDKWLTKLALSEYGVDTPRGRLLVPSDLTRLGDTLALGLRLPVIVKPNYEGSSKGIADESVVKSGKLLPPLLARMLEQYPQGVLVEEFIPGIDVSVPLLEGCGDDGVLAVVEPSIAPEARSKYNLHDFRLKTRQRDQVAWRAPAELPRDVGARVRSVAKTIYRALSIRDLGRIDFRLGEDGRIFFLELNALPNVDPRAALFAATAREGLSYEASVAAVVRSAAKRWKLPWSEPTRTTTGAASSPTVRGARPQPLRVGFTFNMRRVDAKGGNDLEAEYDLPETIAAIQGAIESLGHTVLPMEATADLPRLLTESRVDLVFNIAEGISGRNREAHVPALCELLGVAYTGSDSATLAIALDKALTKKVLKQHDILTPEFQLMATGRERVSATLRFPVIVKPNAEGTSKGISSASVVDSETTLRPLVRELVDRYRQPVLVEEYITGREFTVGLLGDRRPRVLPPMEIVFKDRSNTRPVYDYSIKQDWEDHIDYQCPARLTPTELKAVERAARETFLALDCRDVARVDLRMDGRGQVYVIEANPLPGLTPDYSDLVLIAKAAGMDYRTLIAEILTGGLKRMRERRRTPAASAPHGTTTAGSSTGSQHSP